MLSGIVLGLSVSCRCSEDEALSAEGGSVGHSFSFLIFARRRSMSASSFWYGVRLLLVPRVFFFREVDDSLLSWVSFCWRWCFLFFFGLEPGEEGALFVVCSEPCFGFAFGINVSVFLSVEITQTDSIQHKNGTT